MPYQADVDFLAHYGVKGMRWGKKKGGDPASPSAPRTRNETIRDNIAFGPRGSARVAKRMEEGQTKKQARRREVGRQSAIAAGTATAILGTAYLALVGPQVLQSGLNRAVNSQRARNGAKAAAKLFSDNNGIANHKTVNLVYNAATKSWG